VALPWGVVMGVDAIDRCLRDDLVVHAVGGVQPLVGSCLAGAGERNEHGLRDVLLGEADLASLAAIDVDLHGGVLHLLVDVDVDSAGNLRDLFGELGGEVEVGGFVAGDLEVDGSGQTEVENLVGDVGRGEEEVAVGELLLEVVAQDACVTLGVFAAGLEGDEDVAIAVGDGGRVAEGEVDAAVGQADVVEDEVDAVGGDLGADFLLDGGEVLFGVLEAHALRRIDVQLHLAGVDVREEVAADEEDHGERDHDQQNEEADGDGGEVEAPGEDALVMMLQAFELAIELGVPAPDEAAALFAAGLFGALV